MDGSGDGVELFGLPERDLASVNDRARPDLERLAGARVVVTGGTGFLGSWLVASLLEASQRFGLGLRVVVVSRDPGARGLTARPGLELVAGDVTAPPPLGAFDVLVHGAAPSSSEKDGPAAQPRAMAATILGGTTAMLEQAAANAARTLFVSSGGIYGPQLAPVGESDLSAPDPLRPVSAYAGAKRMAETFCAAATAAGELEAVVARLFAFVGPRIPLGAHFAAGNFLADRLAGRPVAVRGDGRAVRSYLYAGDLPEWIWAILTRGVAGTAYNVGSPDPVTIGALAGRVAALREPPVDVEILGEAGDAPVEWYVPSTDRARDELGLAPRTSLDEALDRTLRWYEERPGADSAPVAGGNPRRVGGLHRSPEREKNRSA